MSLTNRLTAFFLAALALVLGGSFVTLNALAWYVLNRQTNERLAAALGTLTAAVEFNPDGLEWEPNERQVGLGISGGTFRWAARDSEGKVVARSPASGSEAEDVIPALSPATGPESWTGVDIVHAGRPFRVAQRVLRAELQEPAPKADHGHPTLVLTAGIDLAPVRGELRGLAWISGGISLGLWLVAAALGRRLCRRAMVPVTRMAESVRAMGATELSHRLPESETGDEIHDLAEAFNGLLARLQEAFERQQRFTGDASHQLRTPLAAMLGQIEVSLRRDRPADDYRRVLALVRDQAAHLGQIVEMLLFLSRADVEARLPDLEEIELAGWVRRHLELWSEHPRASDLTVEIEDDGPFRVRVHQPLLGQLLDNLLDNASKYSEPGTPIIVRLGRDAGLVALTVEDRGCGIDGEDLLRIFDPFYRSPRARRDGREGVGLGLAIAQRIATALAASLTVRSEPGRGSGFIVLVPDADTTEGTTAPVGSQVPEFTHELEI